MTLFSLINQKKNLALLQNIIRNRRVGNAYLFYGPEGSGMEGFAMEFAAMLNCHSETDYPCGNCSSCRKMRRLEHGNLELVFPIPRRKESSADSDPFKGFTSVDMEEIQEIIHNKALNPYEKIRIPNAKHIPINFIRETKRKTYLRPQELGWKVVIIFDAHLMTEPASNALLKILEEPPKKSTFILTSSNMNAILPTVISRCQPIYFPTLAPTVLKDFLLTKNVPENSINLIMRLSGGNVNQALRLAESDLQTIKDTTLDILRTIAVWNIKKVYKYVEKLSSLYREDSAQFNQILLSMAFWFRDTTILKENSDESELIHIELVTEIKKFAIAFPKFDPYSASSSVENCIDFISRNVYINLALLNMFFNLYHALNTGKNPL